MKCEFCGFDVGEEASHGMQSITPAGDIMVKCVMSRTDSVVTVRRVEPMRPIPERRIYFTPIK